MIRFAVTTVLAILSFVFPYGAFAQSACLVTVRTVAGTKQEARPINSSLSSVKSLLEQLPFSGFEPLDYTEKRLRFEEQGVFSLAGIDKAINSVIITPHGISNGKVKATVEWKGVDGESLVGTRLRVRNGESVGLVVDGINDQSTIVGIQLKCD